MRRRVTAVIIALLLSAIMTFVFASGVLSTADNYIADKLYQRERTDDNNIIIIGYDEQSLGELGRFQNWGRSLWAEAITILNIDPECRPSAIGIDTFFDTNGSLESDDDLATAAAIVDNVVFASFVQFGEDVVENENGSFYLDTNAVLDYVKSYSVLDAVSRSGHVNVTFDADGIIRHAKEEIELPDGTWAVPFSHALYELHTGSTVENPSTRDGKWYINFTGKPGMFFYYSFDDLINGKISPNSLKNRVVLLGPYAVGLADDYITSIDRSKKMFGVEIQANILNALLREDFSVEVSELPQLIILFFVTFLLICVLLRRRFWLSALISFAAALAWLGLCILLRREYGAILHPLYVPAAVILTFVGTLAYNYFIAAKERRKVTDTFKKYVAPDVVNEILKMGADLTLSRTVDLAVLFVDIRGFTAMSEALQNELGDDASARVVDVLNRYLTLTSSCVKKNGGTLDKFIGDATMAFWGAPFPHEDYIYLAVKAGMDMIAEAREIEEELREKSGKRVGFGIGVHVGKAVVGNVGATDRMDYTAIGDTVNTAARLEANAPAGELWISKAVADALKDKLSVTSLGIMKFKNKSEFEVFRADELS